jgi:hypothetical protein
MKALILSLVILAAVFLPSLACSSEYYFTAGKFNRWNLYFQFANCEPESSCDRCMIDFYPDIPNVFDGRDTKNCNGIHPAVNFLFRWESNLGDEQWESFFLNAAKSTIQSVIDVCTQNYTETHCSYYQNDTRYDIAGAYLLGTEIKLGDLENHIDRDILGPHPDPGIYWGNFLPYMEYAVAYAGDLGHHPWKLAYLAAGAYWADLATITASMDARDQLAMYDELQLAVKIFAHALICWQSCDGDMNGSWGCGISEMDFLTPNRLEPFPYAPPEAVPSFVFWLADAVSGIIRVPTNVEQNSWGGIKEKYYDPGE